MAVGIQPVAILPVAVEPEVVAAGRIMFSLAGSGGLVYKGGIAGIGGGLAGCLALLLMWKW